MWRLWRRRRLVVVICIWRLQSGSRASARPWLQVLQSTEGCVVRTAGRMVMQMKCRVTRCCATLCSMVNPLTEGFGLQRHHKSIGGLALCLPLLCCLSPAKTENKYRHLRHSKSGLAIMRNTRGFRFRYWICRKLGIRSKPTCFCADSLYNVK